jgi:hypothetical protein
MRIPDKYLQLNASFQRLKGSLSSIGLKTFDVEGILTGDPMSFISLLQQLLFSPSRSEVFQPIVSRHGISPSMSDHRLVSSIFRMARSELGMCPSLSVEQFLLPESFTIKKIELVTELITLLKKSCSLSPPDMTHRQSCPKTLVVEDEDERCGPPRPIPEVSTSVDALIEKLYEAVQQMAGSISELDCRIKSEFECIDARLSLLEGRLRLLDKLSVSN